MHSKSPRPAAPTSLWGLERSQPLFQAMGLSGAMAILVFGPPTIVLLRHASSPLAALLAYALMASLFWSTRWGAFTALCGRGLRSVEGRALLALAAIALISAMLSPAGDKALESAVQMSLGGCVVAALIAASAVHDDDRFAIWLTLGCILAAALVIADMSSTGRIRGALSLAQRASDANRGAVMLAVASPGLLFLALSGRRGRAVAALALIMATLAAVASQSASARLALAAGVAGSLAAWLGGRRATAAIATLMALIVLATPWLMRELHGVAPALLFERTPYLSVEIRALIWREYASLVFMKPLFGHGLEASAIAGSLFAQAGLSPSQLELLRIGHPHNALLQVWFELGAAGAVVIAALVYLIGRRIAAMPGSVRAAATGTMAAVFAVATVSHGAWQVWWPCLVGIVLVGFPRPSGRGAGPLWQLPWPREGARGLVRARGGEGART